ncbi:MAG: NAD(P)H-dependent oxidoreductase subunit E [Dehalococcoidia bacterium]|nr:NAD(P)H-dependent oxidoreductase subunit E [Dehalococcoidia bacterium]
MIEYLAEVNLTHHQSDITPEERQKLFDFLNSLGQHCSREQSDLIPILQGAQSRIGYLPAEAMLGIAEYLGIPEIDVYSVATFYNQFRLNPPGKHSIRVCLGTACHIGGGHIILDAWKRRLGIDKKQTTPDREFDLDTVACVGCCAMAPVTVIDSTEVHGKVSPTRVDGLLLGYKLQKEKEASA